MRAIIVSVDYTDELRLTLPYNRSHFESVHVVTSSKDADNVRPVAAASNAEVIVTDLFYEGGAKFNKWRALEYGLDVMGRQGWLCVMDADVFWPKRATLNPVLGNLYTPMRRMYPEIPPSVPEEFTWKMFPVHRNVGEFAGYSQIFHADDPVLGPAPWHQTDWEHAGGADSIFQRKWPSHLKVRPSWDCLHIGSAGQNWYGRSTPHADGTLPEGAAERKRLVDSIWVNRRKKPDPEFRGERTVGH